MARVIVQKKLAVSSVALPTTVILAIATTKGMPGEQWGASLSIPILIVASISALALAIYGSKILIPPNRNRD